jgi:acetylornithine deacetylase
MPSPAFADPASTLQQIIRLASVNPMGRSVSGDIYFESRVTAYLEAAFRQLQLPFERHTVDSGRDNVLARIEGGPNRPTLVLEVHQDTVPIDGMTIDPFAAELRDGRIYGRGACDVKGAMACILAVAERLVAEPIGERPNIVIACTVNEEHGFTGATQLAQLWQSGKSKLLPNSPNAILVSEPTQMNVVVAHKGVVRWRCHAQGRAAHSSDPSKGDNAIYRMARALTALDEYAREIAPTRGEHPLLGRPTLSVGTIAGGISVNTVPDRCVIEIDRRILPDEEPEAAQRHVIEHLRTRLGRDADLLEHEKPFIIARGLKDDRNADLARRVIAAAAAQGVTSKPIGVPFGTDASAFGKLVPTVIFGPGDIAQAHTNDEWIAVEQLTTAVEVLHELCRRAW